MKIRNFPLLLIILTLIIPIFSTPPIYSTQAAGTVQTDTTSLQIWNRALGPIVFQLSGPKKYSFIVKPDEKLTVQVLKGDYRYSYVACNKTQTDKISIKKPAKINTVKCEVAKVTMINNTSGPMTLKLSGPAEYFFTLQTGKTKIEVVKGKYKFLVHSDCMRSPGGNIKGAITLFNGMRWPWFCRIARTQR